MAGWLRRETKAASLSMSKTMILWMDYACRNGHLEVTGLEVVEVPSYSAQWLQGESDVRAGL